MAFSNAAEDPSSTALTEYEKQRLENVRRNEAMIAALGIQSAKSEIQQTASKRAEVKGYKRSTDRRSKEREEPVVTRRLRSSRISWTSEDAEKLESPPTPGPDKKKVLTLEKSRKPVPLSSVCIQGSSTERFISHLQELDEHIPLSRSSPSKRSKLEEDSIDPRAFTLQRSDIARVVPERIMSNAFLPVNDKLLVVAGDKGGHLGFWDVEWDDEDGDGVHVYQPHTAPISGIAVQPHSASKVLTCSYDGTVKQLDVETSMFDLMYSLEDDDEVLSAMCSAPGSPHCAYIGEDTGSLKMLDTREKVPSSCGQIHQRRINTIDLNMQSPWLMVTSSTDSNVCVWDVRKMKSDQDRVGHVQHQKAVHSAQFSPSGSYIATCSYDNTIALMKVFCKEHPTYIQHPNTNNRWISTFRAIWGWDDNYIFVGNMKRTIDVISTKLEAECCWLSSPLMTSISCRLMVHPLRPGILAGCTAGGQIYMWRANHT